MPNPHCSTMQETCTKCSSPFMRSFQVLALVYYLQLSPQLVCTKKRLDISKNGRGWIYDPYLVLQSVELSRAQRFLSSDPDTEDIVKDAKDAAHFTAHVAGMIHTRSAKAWAQQSASRSAEALDQAQSLGELFGISRGWL